VSALDAFKLDIERDGWSCVEEVIDATALNSLETELGPLIRAANGRGGVRNLLLSSPAVRRLTQGARLRTLATSVLGPACGAVRVIYFDKTPDTNWRVIWHQDLTIAVAAEVPAAGYGPWSEKDGVVHVQPPSHVLEGMIAIRVHLDDCDASNGPVRVLPGSHCSGRLSPGEIDAWKARVEPVECHVRRGGVVAFRPLILHASSPAREPRHRRVIHIEYANAQLGAGLAWHTWLGAAAPAPTA
jgi:hypothetical protein